MTPIPSGTITFLFTDIENSTTQWEHYPEQMKIALGKHDEILRNTIESNNGHVFKTVGDAFCAAFDKPIDALFAAIECQEKLIARDWKSVLINVRMGIHTGTAEERDNDYFGQTLNRTARLMSVGHGGQILVSNACEELLRDNLPGHIQLKNLGSKSLKDLERPETISQVVCSGLIKEFPSLRIQFQASTNLPLQLTSFIGRKKDLKNISKLMKNTRLLTLLGPGGVGKTRLSIHTSSTFINIFDNGIWFIDLSHITNPDNIYKKIAEVLKISDEASISIDQNIIHYMKKRDLLLVLDNCEHLIQESAEVVYAILMNCPKVKILATSREPLKILGEVTYRVPSLDLPSTKITDPEKFNQYESAELFIDRALSVNPGFRVTNQSAPALVQICTWLDGMPLSLELAAEKTRVFGLTEIAERLKNRFKLLKSDQQNLMPRQKTLRALIDWSYNLLSTDEQILLAKLSIFTDRWDCQTVESICDDNISLTLPHTPLLYEFIVNKTSSNSEKSYQDVMEDSPVDIVELLSALVNKSLVTVETEDGKTKYRLLESVHEYARGKLKESGTVNVLKERFINYYIIKVEKIELITIRDINEKKLLKMIPDYNNIQLALKWGAEEVRYYNSGKRLVGALYPYWKIFGLEADGCFWSKQFLSLPEMETDIKIQWKLLWGASTFAFLMEDFTNSENYIIKQLEMCKVLDSEIVYALTLKAQGMLYFNTSTENIYEIVEKSLFILKKHNLNWWVSVSMMNLSGHYAEAGRLREGNSLLEKALELARKTNQSYIIAMCTMNLSDVELHYGNYDKCIRVLKESLSILEELGNRVKKVSVLNKLGRANRFRGDLFEAEECLINAILTSEEMGFNIGLERTYCYLGLIKIKQGFPDEGKKMLYKVLIKHEPRDMDKIDLDIIMLFTMTEILYLLGYKKLTMKYLNAITSLMKKWEVDFSPLELENYKIMKEELKRILSPQDIKTVYEEGSIMSFEQLFESTMEIFET